MTSIITIYTDGSCHGNGTAFAVGGWAAILENQSKQLRITGQAHQTTNQRMELQAALEGLRAVKNTKAEVHLYTDSSYVQKGCMEWLPAWKRNGWRRRRNKAILNDDLWRALDEQLQRLKVEVHWVKGHNGHPMNELADQLAGLASEGKGKASVRRRTGDLTL